MNPITRLLKPAFLRNAEEHLNTARIEASNTKSTLEQVNTNLRHIESQLGTLESQAKAGKIDKKSARLMALEMDRIRRGAEQLLRITNETRKKTK